LKEITIPDDYTGTISQENSIIVDINNNFAELEEMILSIPDEQMTFTTHIADSESYSIDIYFSENKNHVRLEVADGIISLDFGNNIVKMDADGNII
jgi:hypothetical protein